ncbi:dTMP kinase [Castellaniella sp. GW247-6E4]|uniref:dTMP kinase n=1 Tax=Castellaniella sp. GW247-6E4 TaxID=3140380 RepID=UPI003315E916
MSDDRRNACFLTLEGLDGAGKSTHVQWMADALRRAGIELVCTREPGGTALGEALRELVLREPMDLRTETLLMFAARNEHLRTVILPALERGQWVLCDRFTDATYAYQGGGRGLGPAPIAALEAWVQGEFAPDRTFLFDVPLAVARQRLDEGRDAPDRFEREGAAFFERTRAAYHARVAAHPERFTVIDSTQSIDHTRGVLAAELRALLASHGRDPGGL